MAASFVRGFFSSGKAIAPLDEYAANDHLEAVTTLPPMPQAAPILLVAGTGETLRTYTGPETHSAKPQVFAFASLASPQASRRTARKTVSKTTSRRVTYPLSKPRSIDTRAGMVATGKSLSKCDFSFSCGHRAVGATRKDTFGNFSSNSSPKPSEGGALKGVAQAAVKSSLFKTPSALNLSLEFDDVGANVASPHSTGRSWGNGSRLNSCRSHSSLDGYLESMRRLHGTPKHSSQTNGASNPVSWETSLRG